MQGSCLKFSLSSQFWGLVKISYLYKEHCLKIFAGHFENLTCAGWVPEKATFKCIYKHPDISHIIFCALVSVGWVGALEDPKNI